MAAMVLIIIMFLGGDETSVWPNSYGSYGFCVRMKWGQGETPVF